MVMNQSFNGYPDSGRYPVSDYCFDHCLLLPGFCDVHVHFREPGFSYKETVHTGSLSAQNGGYSTVCTMPNLSPVPDCLEHLLPQLDLIRSGAVVEVLPYGSITVGEKGGALSAFEELAPYVCAFSDDGVGVADRGMMREAMERCHALGKVIAGHCEDMAYSDPGEREWRELERNILLSQETGCSFHACHVSTCESVQLIREAKASHINVSCETAPHYLLLDDGMLDHGDGRYRMNPPIHRRCDRDALLEAICDGTVDMIATDHAPHTVEEKAGGANGIVGLDCAFPVLYTGLVLKGILSLRQLISLMNDRPRSRFGLSDPAVSYLWDLDAEYTVDPGYFQSMGRSTPFEGWSVRGRRVSSALSKKAQEELSRSVKPGV